MILIVIAVAVFFAFFLASYFADSWFPRLPSIKKLHQNAGAIDSQEIETPPPPVTIRALRCHGQIGSKIVVVHGLVKIAAKIQRKVSRDILFSLLGGAAMQVAIVLYSIKDMKPTASTSTADVLNQIATNTWDLWMVPLAPSFALFLYVLVLIFFLEDQAHFHLESVREEGTVTAP